MEVLSYTWAWKQGNDRFGRHRPVYKKSINDHRDIR